MKADKRNEKQDRTEWRKGWTPWGTPCSVRIVGGRVVDANATEKTHCPVKRLAA